MSNEFVSAPTAQDVQELYRPGMAVGPSPPDPSKEIVAVQTACFAGIAPWVFDSHRLLTAQIVRDYGDNAWILPTRERMPYPDSLLYGMCMLFNAEKHVKQRADWILYVEDDVSVPKDLLRMLRKSADPEKRPFMSTVGFVRKAPFLPAVWGGSGGELEQWHDVPDQGVYQVAATGFCAVLMHRSLFDRVEQPWWLKGNNMKKVVDGMADVGKGFNPDNWWCGQLTRAGIPIYVDCEPVITHFGLPLPINRKTAPVLRELSFFRDKQALELEARGEYYHKDGCAVHNARRLATEETQDGLLERDGRAGDADLRQSLSESVGGTHGPGDAIGPVIAT